MGLGLCFGLCLCLGSSAFDGDGLVVGALGFVDESRRAASCTAGKEDRAF